MFLFRYYDKEARIDRAWYNSSNILYSECDDVLDGLKILTVTFKNGATYRYNNVDVNDYVMFLHGSIDGSNGKALNKYIKAKYEYERLEDRNPSLVMAEMDKYKLKAKKDKENENVKPETA